MGRMSLLDNLVIQRKEENVNAPDLVNIGSCGLHVLHGCFRTASKKTSWSLETSLNSFYKNIKGSRARQADYLELNGLNEMHDQKCSCFFHKLLWS